MRERTPERSAFLRYPNRLTRSKPSRGSGGQSICTRSHVPGKHGTVSPEFMRCFIVVAGHLTMVIFGERGIAPDEVTGRRLKCAPGPDDMVYEADRPRLS